MSEELLPCPFCGGKAVIRIDATRPASFRDRLRVGCETAGCRGFYHAAWVYYETPEQAIEAWNTRADARSRYTELFGTPERAARTLHRNGSLICRECLIRDECVKTPEDSDCMILHYDALLEWLRGDA